MGQGIRELELDYAETSIVTDGSGNGEQAVTFAVPYVSLPDTLVVQNEADQAAGAVYRVKPGSLTISGMIVQVVGSTRVSRTIRVIYLAHEKD